MHPCGQGQAGEQAVENSWFVRVFRVLKHFLL